MTKTKWLAEVIDDILAKDYPHDSANYVVRKAIMRAIEADACPSCEATPIIEHYVGCKTNCYLPGRSPE